MKSRRRFERSGVKIYLLYLEEGEAGHAAAPDAALVLVSAQFVLKSRHPHVADYFRFTRGTAMDHRCL